MSKCCDFCNDSLLEPSVILIESPDFRVHICENCTVAAYQQFKELKKTSLQELVNSSNSPVITE